MREYHGSIPLRNAQRDEEQEERDTDDDVAVEYRNVVDKLDGITCIAVAQVVDADGCQVPKSVDTVAVIRAMVTVLTSAAVSEWCVPSAKRFL